MKSMSPEERELESMSAGLRAHYRVGALDEPAAQVDALILAAARREVAQPRTRRHWQVPVSLAAMLVIGTSLVLLVRESEPPLPSMERPAAAQSGPANAKSAGPDAPAPAMKHQPGEITGDDLPTRPSRQRSSRDDRPAKVPEQFASAPAVAAGEAARLAAAPKPEAAGRMDAIDAELTRLADDDEAAARTQDSGADAAGPAANSDAQAPGQEKKRLEQPALLKKEASAPLPQPEWLANIEELLHQGKEAEARLELNEFQKRYPQYRLPGHLQALLARDQR